MKKIIIASIAVMALAAGVSFAEDINPAVIKGYAADKSPAIRVKNGFSEVVKIEWAAGDSATNRVLVGSTVNTLACDGTNADQISEAAALFAAVTNAAGQKLLTVDVDCSLNADNTSNTLANAANQVVLQPGEWGNAVLWDTSACLFYSTYIPNTKSSGGGQTPLSLKDIFGNITGTGNITVNIYEDQTKVFEDVIVSPVYVWGAISSITNTTAADAVSSAQLLSRYQGINLPISANKDVLIRATRATSATTGFIGTTVQAVKP